MIDKVEVIHSWNGKFLKTLSKKYGKKGYDWLDWMTLLIRDDTHVMSMKIVQISRPFPCPSTSENFPPPWPWMSNFEWPPPPLNDNQLIKRKHDRRMTIICYQQINYRIIHHLQWLLLTLSRMGYWPGYLWWLWLASHCLPYFLHTSYPQFPHWEWVERQESVDLVASALSHIRFHAYDICSRHKSNLL